MSTKKRKRKSAGPPARSDLPGQMSRPAAPPGTMVRASGTPPNRAARRAKAVRPRMARPRIRLGENGEIGYGCDPARTDDCFRAAIATATQTDPSQIPDLRLADRLKRGDDPDEISAESWERIARWAERRGLRLMLHKSVPADRERWIGVCVTPWQAHILVDESDPFVDHCLIMSYGEIIFDPAASVLAAPGTRVATWELADVTYGLSFDPINPEKE